MRNQERAAIYWRVSTLDQSAELQESELREYADRRGWNVYRVYTDRGQCGAKSSRPQLDEMMADCRRRKVDVVLVWKFDRFARSLKHLVNALEEFKGLGVDLVSCTEAIDTSIPSGTLVFQIFGAVSQFERELIRERVRAGLAHAKKQGKQLGRPAIRRLTGAELERVRHERCTAGISLRQLAAKYRTSLWAIQQAAR